MSCNGMFPQLIAVLFSVTEFYFVLVALRFTEVKQQVSVGVQISLKE